MDIKMTERILKALANKRRLEIIKYLYRAKEAKVGNITGTIKLSFKATSKHLGILASTNIVEKEQRSLEVWYSLSPIQSDILKSAVNTLK